MPTGGPTSPGGADRLMALQVFTAVTGAAWESELVGALDRADHGVTVVRRCVDVSELLAAAATGTGQAALLSAELRRLDGDAVARLEAAGVAVVGLVEPGDERGGRPAAPARGRAGAAGRRRAGGDRAGAARGGRRASPASGRDVADPRAALPALGVPDEPRGPAGRAAAASSRSGVRPARPGGRRSPSGWPTRRPGWASRTLLVDADVYGGVVAQVLGLLDESPGLAGAARLAGGGTPRRAPPWSGWRGRCARSCAC